MTSSGPITRLLSMAGVDFHVLTTLLSRGWSVLAGVLTVLLVPLFLSPTEQGYYYTFASLVGLQILFELGLGQVVLQMVSHEMAHLRIGAGSTLEGDDLRRDRLASLMQMLRKWYILAAVLFALLAGSIGAFFIHQQAELPNTDWVGIWLVMVLCTAVNLSVAPALAFMEGCGQVGQVARLRLAQTVVGYSCLWLALLTHLGLWAACMVPLASTVITLYWVHNSGTLYRGLLAREFQVSNALNWSRDVLPFQWRVALSALSGYFTFYVMTPLVFGNWGAVEAGRFGIAMTAFNALATVSTSWVYARTPAMAMHVSRNERPELNAVFRAVLKRSLIFAAMATSVLLLVVWALKASGVPQVLRISEMPVLMCLAAVCLSNCVIFSAAAYMRSHREEPMLPISVAGGIATALIAYYGSRESVLIMSMAYAALTVGVLLPWTLVVFSSYYRRR
jgi:O-antigen/teichoic acid export membrane protein